MIRRWLSYLLIALIATQSALAVAEDKHQSHQQDSQHLEFNHEHGDEMSQADKEVYSYSGVKFDCHHCCHCHHLPHFAVICSNSTVYVSLLKPDTTDYNLNYLSKRLSPELRPPIA